MSAKVWCRFGDGTENEDLHPTEEGARQSLLNTLEKHKVKGCSVTEQQSGNNESIQYVVTDANGSLVAMYQITD